MPRRTFKELLVIMRANPEIQRRYQDRLDSMPVSRRYNVSQNEKHRILEDLVARHYREAKPRSENARWLDNCLTMVGVDAL